MLSAMDLRTSTLDVETRDGVADAYLAAPEGLGPYPGVLLYSDAFGPRPQLERMAQRLAAAGYVVLLPHVLYREGRSPLLDTSDLRDPSAGGRLFETLRPWLRRLTPERAMSDAEAYVGVLTGHDEVSNGPLGVVGYCMGGALALRTAAHLPERFAAAAAFHPGRLATDEPDSPHLLASRLRAEVYVACADHDRSMPREQQERLDAALTAAGVRHVCEQYDGTTHGFTMADTAAYDEAAAERHWERLLDLFGRTLH
jgi:carboxymethylenebutenolidase